MATISASIALQDKMTPVMSPILRSINNVISGMERMDKASQNCMDTKAIAAAKTEINRASAAMKQFETSMAGAAKEQNNLTRATSNGTTASNGFMSSLKGVATTIATVVGLGKMVNMADTYSNTISRLNLMNDGLQTTDQLQNNILSSANDARAQYQSMADMVGKLGIMAGGAFESSDQIVRFAELLQKNYKIAGTSASEAASATTQLTQALASGVLRGDELNSVMENAPTVIQAIERYLGVDIAQIRKLAEEGELTADVITKAMFASADQTEAAFQAIKPTFSDIWTVFSNNAGEAWEKVNRGMSDLANSPGMTTFFANAVAGIENLTPAISAIVTSLVDMFNDPGVQNFINGIIQGMTKVIGVVAGAIPTVVDFITQFTGVDGIANGFLVLVGGVVAFKAAMAGMGAFTAISGLVTSFTGAGTAATAAGTAATAGTSGIAAAFAAITGPVALVVAGIAAVTAVIVGAWQQSEIFRNSVSTAFDSIGKTITAAMDQVKPALDPAMQAFQGFAAEAGPILQQIGDVLGTYVVPAITWFANTMITAFAGAITAAAPLLTAVGNVFSFIGNGVGAICAILNGDWAGAWNYGGAMVQSAKDAICNSLTAIWQMGGFILGGIVNSVVNSFNGIVSFISGIGGTLQDVATTTFWNVVIGAASGLLDLYSAVTTGFDDALAFVRDLPKQFKQWGGDMIQKMIDGIKSMVGSATDAVGDIVSNIVTRFKEGFGIHSPSTVLYDIGSNLIQGLVNSVLDSNIMTFFNGIIEDIKDAFAGGSFGIKTFIDFVGGSAAEFLQSIGVGGASFANLVQPVSGAVTSGFGYRDPFMTDSGEMSSGYHAGIDIGAGFGTPVGAAGAGEVTMAGWNGGYGNTVMIDHGNGLSSMYAHLSEIMASVGQMVSAGQTVGLVGSTGNSTGAHLHFGLFQDGAPIDPSALFGYANGTNFARSGPHWVGENGPEILNFAGGEKVLDAKKSKELVSTAGGRKSTLAGKPTFNNTVNVSLSGLEVKNDIDIKKIARLLGDEIEDQMVRTASGLYRY